MKRFILTLAFSLQLSAFAYDTLIVDTNNVLKGRTNLGTPGTLTLSNQFGKSVFGPTNLMTPAAQFGSTVSTNSYASNSTTTNLVAGSASTNLTINGTASALTKVAVVNAPLISGNLGNTTNGTLRSPAIIDPTISGNATFSSPTVFEDEIYYEFFAPGILSVADGTGGLIEPLTTAWPLNLSSESASLGIYDGSVVITTNSAVTNLTFGGTNWFPTGSSIAFGIQAVTSLADGANAGVPLGTNVAVKLSGNTGAATIAGLNGQPNRHGDFRILQYDGSATLTWAHASGLESTAANRLYSYTGGDLVSSGPCSVLAQYDGVMSRWKILNFESLNANAVSAAGVAAIVYTNTGLLSVKAFGAVGDGVTDDSVAVSNAVYHANLWGRTVYFPQGTYLDTNSYVFTDTKLSIIGEHKMLSIWKFTSTNAGVRLNFSTRLPHITRLRFEGPGKSVRGVTGIAGGGIVQDSYFADVSFAEWGLTGCQLDADAGGVVKGLDFYRCGVGLRIAGYSDGVEATVTARQCTIGVMVGGVAQTGFNAVQRAVGVKLHITGNYNYVGVAGFGASFASTVSGYMEQNTNNFWVGLPPTNAITYSLYQTNEIPTYVGALRIQDYGSLEATWATNVAVWCGVYSLMLQNVANNSSTNAQVQVMAWDQNTQIKFDNCRASGQKMIQWHDGVITYGSYGGVGFGRSAVYQRGRYMFYDTLSRGVPILSVGSDGTYSGAEGSPSVTVSNGTLRVFGGGMTINGGSATNTGTGGYYLANNDQFSPNGLVIAAKSLLNLKTNVINLGTNYSGCYTMLLTNNTWMAQPINLLAGQAFTIQTRNDATGGYAVNWDTNYWRFPNGQILTMTTNANAWSIISCMVDMFATNVAVVQTLNFQ